MKKSEEFRNLILWLLPIVVLLVFFELVRPAQVYTSPALQRKALVEAAARVRDDLNRALHLLETCFGHPIDLDRVRSVPVTLTAYTSTVEECDSTPYITASQKPVRRGTIAISDDLVYELGLTFGQKVLIPGYGIFEVQDRMHPRWRRTVDIWYDDRKAAVLFGRQEGTILWISPLDGTDTAGLENSGTTTPPLTSGTRNS